VIIADIVSQHAEEAAFLWLLRDNATRAPHYNLADLADLEERVDAHLDGLRVAGEEAWAFCAEGLKHEEVGEVFAAGYFALGSGRQDWLSSVLQVVGATPETARGLISALGWIERDKLQGQVVDWLKSTEPSLRKLGLGACAVQRVDCGTYLDHALADANAGVRARALRSVGELRRQDLSAPLASHLDDEDDTCRFWAAWSAALLGESQGVMVLQSLAATSTAFGEAALQLALRAMEVSAAVAWVRELNQAPEQARRVIQATGIIGDPASIPWLIERMKVPELARVAGEAFSMITGIDMAYDDLEADWPEGFEAGPTEDADDANVAMDADEDLPWPAPQLLGAWWHAHQQAYSQGTRYLCGQPIRQDSCLDVLKTGQQRQRRAAALELALLNPGQPLFNTSATARRQMQLLGMRLRKLGTYPE
jgi:uncharacterized protein (TIGR02270 family)